MESFRTVLIGCAVAALVGAVLALLVRARADQDADQDQVRAEPA